MLTGGRVLLQLLWLAVCVSQHQALQHISPPQFETQLAPIKLALVLFCQASQGSCGRLERVLAEAATKLAAERSTAAVHMVDTSEWGGEELRKRYGTVDAPLAPELIIFRSGQAVPYTGKRNADALYDNLRALSSGNAPPRREPPRPAHAPDDEEPPDFLLDQPADAVLSLTSSSFHQALVSFPLLFVLFYSGDKGPTPFLQANFSAAASMLHEQRINARLAKIEVRRDWPESMRSTLNAAAGIEAQMPPPPSKPCGPLAALGRLRTSRTRSRMLLTHAHACRSRKPLPLMHVAPAVAERISVAELPDIKIFRWGRGSGYHAGAATIDLVDVARWNAGNLNSPTKSSVHEVEATSGFEELLSKHRLVLLAFTTRWCARCLTLQTEFAAASLLLSNAEPPVALASVNLDNPRNRALVERFGVLSFPVGKIFHRGRLVGDFMGGSLAHEIVTEMLSIRDDLRRAEEATEAEAAAAAQKGGAQKEGAQKEEL